MDLSFLSESTGKWVLLERGGPDRLEGILRSVMSDCLAIETENEGIVYAQAHHIKTISEPLLTEVQMTGSDSGYLYGLSSEDLRLPVIQADSFHHLLQKLESRLVRVNHGGPNSLLGVLMDIRPDVITILHDMKDYVHYPIFHIRSITWIHQTRDKASAK